MGMKKKILNIVLSFFSIFLCFFQKKKNRVTFVSLTSETLKGDLKLIADELNKYKGIELYTILTKYDKTVWGNISYFFNCIKQLFIINTSSVVIINDNNYVISNFKKDYPIVIQIWHACGAVKKFGNEIKREYPIRNYDYVITTSDLWRDIYAKSFGIDVKKTIPLGMARTDVLFDTEAMLDKKTNFYDKYPILKNKYVVLYAPTFRGNIIKGMSYIPINLDKIISKVPDDYIIIYKMHPLLGDIELGKDARLIKANDEELYSLFSISDCLITDYSSITFDFTIMNKKQIYYLPDLETYQKEIGLNISFDELPGIVCHTEEQLIEILKDRSDCLNFDEFEDKFFKFKDGKSAERIAAFIYEKIKNRN